VPGGSIQLEGDKICKWGSCIFDAAEDMDTMHSYEQVFVKLMRRYKYLEKMFVDEMNKILVYLKGFTDSERTKLARMTALWLTNGSIPPSVLLVMLNVSDLNLYYLLCLLTFCLGTSSERLACSGLLA